MCCRCTLPKSTLNNNLVVSLLKIQDLIFNFGRKLGSSFACIIYYLPDFTLVHLFANASLNQILSSFSSPYFGLFIVVMHLLCDHGAPLQLFVHLFFC